VLERKPDKTERGLAPILIHERINLHASVALAADDALAADSHAGDPFGAESHTALGPVVMAKGRYTLWVVYASSCIGAELHSAGGSDAPPPAGLFEGTIASNGITVEVTLER
jgi:hypothetical protein